MISGKHIVLCMMAVLCAAAFTGCGTKTVEDKDPVMEVAGQSVAKEEYQLILRSYAAQVKGQYTTDQANREDFWKLDQPEGTPLSQIMELAGQDILHKKTVARLAREAGIEDATDYGAVMEEMALENDHRQETGDLGGIVYGLTSFTPEDYYSYVYTQVEAQLLESLKQDHEVTDKELEQVYQENIGQYTSAVRVEMLVAEMSQEAGMELAGQAALDMQKETDMDRLKEQYPDINFYEIAMSSLNTQEGKSGGYTLRWTTASAMQEGEVCEPFLIGKNIMAMRCLKRSEQTPEPFEEVKGVLKSDIQTGLAQEDISRAEQEAELILKVSEQQLENIALEALGE